MTSTKHLIISRAQGTHTLSAAQKKFNTLIQKIEAQRALAAAWTEASTLFQQRYHSEFEPLLRTWETLNTELLHLLDQRVDEKGFSKSERRALRDIICDIAAGLMQGGNRDEIKAVYDRNSPVDFDTGEREQQQALKAMVEGTFGLDLGDGVDMNSPEDLMQRLQREMDERQAAQAQAAGQQRSRRKPTARQLRQQAEAQQASQSIRDVFRKLASTLHPDREADPAERMRKTALMQRVNQAYAANDLLGMLRLQLEVEQIDQNAIDNIADDRLKHYNKLLAEQLSQLQAEVRAMAEGLRMQFNLDPFEKLSPSNLMQVMRRRVQGLGYDIHQLKIQRRALNDVAGIKRWLKEQRSQDDDLEMMPAELGWMFR